MSNKDRLYVCLYARGGQPKMSGLEDTYHWALMVGPKSEGQGKRGMRYHAKESLGPRGFQWEFTKQEVSLQPTNMLLVRIVVGKIVNNKQLDTILGQIPIRADITGWNCVSWVKEALAALENDGKVLGTRVTEWDRVRNTAMQYCQQKKTQGRFTTESYNPQKAPTYDLMEDKEVIA